MATHQKVIGLIAVGIFCIVLFAQPRGLARSEQGRFNLAAWDGGKQIQRDSESSVGTTIQGPNIYQRIITPNGSPTLTETGPFDQTFDATHELLYQKSHSSITNVRENMLHDGATMESNEGKLSLFVRDGITGYGVKSEILFSSAKDTQLVSTNEGGILEFVAESGRFDLTINTPGYKQMKTFFSITPNQEVKTNIWLDRESNNDVTETENESTAVIKGYVVDGGSGKPIEGASVYFTTIDKRTSTDKNGYFRIESETVSKLEGDQDDSPRRVNIEFTKESFRDYAVENFLLVKGVVTLRITLEKGQDKVIENYFQSILDKQNENTEIHERPGDIQEQGLNNNEKDEGVLSPLSCPAVPTTIRVGTGCPSPVNCSVVCSGTVQTMSLESYVQSGLDNEWFSTWMPASLQAGAVAYRTYGAYYVINQPLQNPNYDIRSDTCNQAWGSATASSCINAANATVGEVIVNSSNVIVKSEYAAETNNAGCGNGFSGTGTTWPCISDSVCSGFAFNGHGRGMCQNGSNRWATQGQVYTWILDHYYNPGSYFRCGSSQPSPTPTLTVRSVSATSVQVNQPFTVSTTLSVSNGTADHAGISISLPSLTSSGVTGTPPSESYNSTQGTVTTASSSSLTGSTLQYYDSGETLTCGSSSCSAQHLLVEGDWVTVGAGNTRSLNLTVTPKVPGTFKVRIRGWVTAPAYQNPSRDPSSSSTTDQQNFPVYEFTVTVSAPVDSTGPNLSINSHSSGQTVTNSSINVFGTASDSGQGNNGISSVTVNNVAASGGTATGSGTANWNRTFTLNQGANTITVVARDNSANQNATTQSIIVNYQPVDSTGPNLSINSHSSGQTVTNSSINVFGTASDSGQGNNGISSVTVNNVAASGGTATGSGTANWNRTFTLNQGANTITVVARDNSANQNATTQSIIVNYQPVQNNYMIVVSASPSGSGTVTGAGTFAAGSSQTVNATANGGFTFANWTENGNVVSSLASYTFTLNSDRNLVANFTNVSTGNAVYDTALRAPKCGQAGSVCDSGALLDGRDSLSGGPEPNQPNTINSSCADGTNGTYHSDESADRIKVSTPDGSNFAPGKTVNIDTTVWVWTDPTQDHLDLYYATDASNPTWIYMATWQPTVAGSQVFSTTFTLSSGGSLQAVRAVFRFGGAALSCGANSGFDDYDDLIFAVNGSGGSLGTNVALATNGGVATASSTYAGYGFNPAAVNNGDHKGLNWLSGGGWNDATPDAYPDWVQIDFSGSKSISEVDVFTVQDNYANPAEPTDTMTFSQYGMTAFDVQYWTGSNWVTLPGGSVVGNNLVKRKFTFSPVMTSKIRVLVNGALASHSRIAEVEAYGDTSAPPAAGINVALATNGGMATASSTYTGYGFNPGAVNNGEHKGLNWLSGGGWNDATPDAYSDWVQIDFSGSQTIGEIDVFTVQDNYLNPVEPTDTLTFNQYGITAFDVQYWNGSSWVTVPGGSVVENNLVKRRFTFTPLTTSKIRVLVNNAQGTFSRLAEVEAYTPKLNFALATNGGVASASSTYAGYGFNPAAVNNGDHKGLNWLSGGGWNDATPDAYPDWVQIDFSGSKTISEVDVFTVQDNYANPAEPTDTMTFSQYGITGFDVQYWTGSSWVTVPGGSVTGNNRVQRVFTFSPVTTSKIRVLVNGALATYSRIVEMEAY